MARGSSWTSRRTASSPPSASEAMLHCCGERPMKEKRGFSDQVGLGWMDSIPSCNEEEDDDDDQSKYFCF
jgi:hypothetical protein